MMLKEETYKDYQKMNELQNILKELTKEIEEKIKEWEQLSIEYSKTYN